MNIAELSNENKVFIRTIFKEMRLGIENFLSERDFVLSNSQLFTFLSNAPAAFAIACDGVVDESEIASLEKISKAIDVKTSVSMELSEMMSIAFEPENSITNEEFNIRAGNELLFLARNAEKHEDAFVKALKAMLTFDFNPKADGSMTSSFVNLMNTMVEKNGSKDKEKEIKKLAELKEKIGIY